MAVKTTSGFKHCYSQEAIEWLNVLYSEHYFETYGDSFQFRAVIRL